MFVNLGKLLRLECDVRQIAIEVPGRFVGADDAASVPTGR